MYNKLVRDNIPNIIEQKGQKPITRILSEEEYLLELNKKLQEEVNEYLQENDTEELADIMEVILGILDTKGISFAELEEIRKNKATKRGAFKDKIYLEGVENEDRNS